MPRNAIANIVVVEDDASMGEAVDYMLRIAGHRAALYSSAEALLAVGIPADANCLLVDVRLGDGMDGLGLLSELRRRAAPQPVVMMTAHADVALAVRAMQQGAVDFIEKPFSGERLLGALDTALARRRAPTDAGEEVARAAELLNALSPREVQVLECLVAGQSNKIVAHTLDISPKTVEGYRASLMIKLRCATFADVVRVAIMGGVGAPARPGAAR